MSERINAHLGKRRTCDRDRKTAETARKRRAELAKLRATGLTLQAIGDREGISRQRVHQILSHESPVERRGGDGEELDKGRAEDLASAQMRHTEDES